MRQTPPLFVRLINNTSLVTQILIGMVAGILLANFVPSAAKTAGLMGTLFVGALKAVADYYLGDLAADDADFGTVGCSSHEADQRPTHRDRTPVIVAPRILLTAHCAWRPV